MATNQTAVDPTTKASTADRILRRLARKGYAVALLGYMGVADDVMFDAERYNRVLYRIMDYSYPQRVPEFRRQIIRDAARFYCDQAYLEDVLTRTTPLFMLRRIAYGALRKAIADKAFPSFPHNLENDDLFMQYFLDAATEDMDTAFDMEGRAMDWIDEDDHFDDEDDGLTSGH